VDVQTDQEAFFADLVSGKRRTVFTTRPDETIVDVVADSDALRPESETKILCQAVTTKRVALTDTDNRTVAEFELAKARAGGRVRGFGYLGFYQGLLYLGWCEWLTEPETGESASPLAVYWVAADQKGEIVRRGVCNLAELRRPAWSPVCGALIPPLAQTINSWLTSGRNKPTPFLLDFASRYRTFQITPSLWRISLPLTAGLAALAYLVMLFQPMPWRRRAGWFALVAAGGVPGFLAWLIGGPPKFRRRVVRVNPDPATFIRQNGD
jgi:hypothetical protein